MLPFLQRERAMLRAGVVGLGLALAGCVPVAAPDVVLADVPLVLSDGTNIGTVRAYQENTGVVLRVEAHGLPPGMHGVHLHAVGKCTPDFAAAGGHFDPGPAGNPDPDANHPYHMGDLPQLAVTGPTATMRVATTRVTLSDGPLSLFDADGSAIIIHGNPDQGITGEPKSGVSGGPRIACGVIEKK